MRKVSQCQPQDPNASPVVVCTNCGELFENDWCALQSRCPNCSFCLLPLTEAQLGTLHYFAAFLSQWDHL